MVYTAARRPILSTAVISAKGQTTRTLDDPLHILVTRHKRVSNGGQYYDVIPTKFVAAERDYFPDSFIHHFEDFESRQCAG